MKTRCSRSFQFSIAKFPQCNLLVEARSKVFARNIRRRGRVAHGIPAVSGRNFKILSGDVPQGLSKRICVHLCPSAVWSIFNLLGK